MKRWTMMVSSTAAAVSLLAAGCTTGDDAQEPEAAAKHSAPIEEAAGDTSEDPAAGLALQACEAYNASYQQGGAGATEQARRFGDAAADANPRWIPLASHITTSVEGRQPGAMSRDTMVRLAQFAEQDEVHRRLGQVCFEEFGLTVKFANGVALVDAGR